MGDLLFALRVAGAARISRRGGRSRVLVVDRNSVTFRDRHGGPHCSQCPDHDARDPRQVVVEVITALDPGLTADTVTAAITATVTKPAHEQKLAWTLENTPETLIRDGAKAPFPMVLRLIDALCAAGATRVQRPACPRCQRVVTLNKTHEGLRICRNCCARACAVACVSAERSANRRHGTPKGNRCVHTALSTTACSGGR